MRMNVDTDRTPDRILLYLKTKGPQAAQPIAKRMGITAMAVRQHLYALRGAGMVEYADERRRVGRPARIWRLAEKAQARFPDSHSELTLEMIGAIRAAFGDAGMERLLAERTRLQTKAYRTRLKQAGGSLEARVAELAKIRSEQGYMAEMVKNRDGSILLLEN